MRFTTLDTITQSVLLQKNLPLHYYLRFLKFGCDCLRELSFDSLKIVNTVQLNIPTTSFACDLPCDYVDWVLVGIPQGQFVRPVTQRDSINQLANYDTTGHVVPFGDAQAQNLDFPFWPGYWMFQNIDDLGENVGRMFGYNTGNTNDMFKIIRERSQIQFGQLFPSNTAILEYISDGQTADNLTKVDPMVQACVEQYINWKRSPNADVERSPEGASYYNQKRIFRARRNGITPWDIRQAMYRNYVGSPKN